MATRTITFKGTKTRKLSEIIVYDTIGQKPTFKVGDGSPYIESGSNGEIVVDGAMRNTFYPDPSTGKSITMCNVGGDKWDMVVCDNEGNQLEAVTIYVKVNEKKAYRKCLLCNEYVLNNYDALITHDCFKTIVTAIQTQNSSGIRPTFTCTYCNETTTSATGLTPFFHINGNDMLSITPCQAPIVYK